MNTTKRGVYEDPCACKCNSTADQHFLLNFKEWKLPLNASVQGKFERVGNTDPVLAAT